jgi:hypothetical protein
MHRQQILFFKELITMIIFEKKRIVTTFDVAPSITVKTVANPYNKYRALEAVKYSTPVTYVEKPKSLRNPVDGSFIVIADDLVLAQSLVERAQNGKLTVSGDGTCAVRGISVADLKPGQILTFGTSRRFDVNIVNDPNFAVDNNMVPVYRLSTDWFTINKALDEMVTRKGILAKKTRPENRTYREMELVEKAAEQRKATSTPKVTKTATSKLQISDNWLKYGNSYYRRPVGNIEVFFS